MSIPKNLQEKRDGEARLCYINGEDSVWSTHNFKQGFDECAALLLPEIEKMRAALESVAAEHLDINHFENHEDIGGIKEMVRFDMQLCRKTIQSWQRFAEGGE